VGSKKSREHKASRFQTPAQGIQGCEGSRQPGPVKSLLSAVDGVENKPSNPQPSAARLCSALCSTSAFAPSSLFQHLSHFTSDFTSHATEATLAGLLSCATLDPQSRLSTATDSRSHPAPTPPIPSSWAPCAAWSLGLRGVPNRNSVLRPPSSRNPPSQQPSLPSLRKDTANCRER